MRNDLYPVSVDRSASHIPLARKLDSFFPRLLAILVNFNTNREGGLLKKGWNSKAVCKDQEGVVFLCGY